MVIEKFTFMRPSNNCKIIFYFTSNFPQKIFYKWNLSGVNIMNCWNSMGISEEFQRFHLFQSLPSNFPWLRWNSTGIPPEWWKDFLVGNTKNTFSKFPDVLPAFTCANAAGNLWSICLEVKFGAACDQWP